MKATKKSKKSLVCRQSEKNIDKSHVTVEPILVLQQGEGATTTVKRINTPSAPPQVYLITQTLYEQLRFLNTLPNHPLKIPRQDKISKIEDELRKRITNCFKGMSVIVESVQFREYCDNIVSLTNRAKQTTPEALVISTAPLLVYETNGECLQLNRLIDLDGNIIGIGPRPGNPPIEAQLQLMGSKVRGRQVIVIEDGSFTGNSLRFVLKKLKTLCAKVETIILGVLFPQAESMIQKIFNGEIICVKRLSNPRDWMPSHDFFPFIPNSGRVLGYRLNGYCVPVYLHNHSSLSVPYILPFTKKPEEWAGLSSNRTEVEALSRFCLDCVREIFSEMESLNHRVIRIDDLVQSYPRTSIPVSLRPELHNAPGLSTRVVDYLHQEKYLF
ncbi:MAG: phosphoribosyltransferase [bacterium]|nr:phosphoribosyltransferase [bacterium]